MTRTRLSQVVRVLGVLRAALAAYNARLVDGEVTVETRLRLDLLGRVEQYGRGGGDRRYSVLRVATQARLKRRQRLLTFFIFTWIEYRNKRGNKIKTQAKM